MNFLDSVDTDCHLRKEINIIFLNLDFQLKIYPSIFLNLTSHAQTYL
jgi:hypothetical protein